VIKQEINKEIVKKMLVIKVKHVIHLAHSFEQVLDNFILFYFILFLPLKVSMLPECIIHLAHIVVKKCDTWFLGFFFPACEHTSLVCYTCCTRVVLNKC